MLGIKNILVATDLTQDSAPAHTAAAFLAERLGANLVIFHVIGELDQRYEILLNDMAAHMRRAADEAIDAASQVLGRKHKVKITTVVRDGAVVEELAAAIKEHKIDLLVMGTGAVHTGDPHRLGITAKRIAHKIAHDMVFVRPGSEGPWDRIMATTDFSGPSGEALQRACVIAKQFGVKSFPVIHSLVVPETFLRIGLDETDVTNKLKAYAEKEFKEWLAKYSADTKGLTIDPVIRVGSPSEVVVIEARNRNTQLIVVGSQGRTASAAVLLGNVAERIIRDAPCSVWAERTEGAGMTFAKAIARIMGIE